MTFFTDSIPKMSECMHRFIGVGNDDHVDVPVADNLWVVLKVSGQEPYVLFAVATCVNGVERERRWH